jgi:transcription initiation factor TFIIE subunit alpha
VRANFSHTEVDATENGDGLKIAGGRHGVEEGVGIVMRTDKDEATRKVEREREAEAKRFEHCSATRSFTNSKSRQQNQMPAWHLTSTISGDLTALGIAQQARDAAMQSPTHILDSLSPFTNTKPIEGLPEANDVKPVIGAKIGGLPVDMKPVVNHQADCMFNFLRSVVLC